MPSKHRNPAVVYRPDPELHDRAKAAVDAVGSDLNAHVLGFLHWLVSDTDQLPPRPAEPQSPQTEPIPPTSDETVRPLPAKEPDGQASASEQTPRARTRSSRPTPAANSSRKRKRYTSDEINAYQFEAVRGESGQILSYRVVVAGEVLGHVERAPGGHKGWVALDTHFMPQRHRGGTGRRYATSREQAVVDLLLGLGYTGTE